MALDSESRGPFARDEIPEDIVMRFQRPADKGGGPVNLTGYTAEVDIVKPDNTLQTKEATISDAEEGETRYTFVDGDFDQQGTLKIQFWALSGEPPSTKLASKVVELTVWDAPRHEAQA